MLAGPGVARPLSVAAELIPRKQAGEFRYCGTEPVCVNQYHPPEGSPPQADSLRETAPQHDGTCIHGP